MFRSTRLDTSQLCCLQNKNGIALNYSSEKAFEPQRADTSDPSGEASGPIWWAERCELQITTFEHWNTDPSDLYNLSSSMLEDSLCISLCMCARANVPISGVYPQVLKQLFLLLRDFSVFRTMLSPPLNAKPSSRVISLGHLKRKLFMLDECCIYENWKRIFCMHIRWLQWHLRRSQMGVWLLKKKNKRQTNSNKSVNVHHQKWSNSLGFVCGLTKTLLY